MINMIIIIIMIIIKVMLVDLQIFCNGGSFSHGLPQACNLLLQLLMMVIQYADNA